MAAGEVVSRAMPAERLGVEPATLDLTGATPRAPAYDDIYFSADGGLAESRHVFIDGNDLRRRLAQWRGPRAFVIGETGFGTGRNVLVAWQILREVARAATRLHIVSIERHPPRARDLAALWAAYPGLAPEARRLGECWPALMRGTHRLRLDDRVTLDLIFDDVEIALGGFDGRADAWFLDGFAPARNPAMWSRAVFDRLAAASRPAATFATYTCARLVREHAAAAGFVCGKRPGAGRKRDMLCGHLGAAAGAAHEASIRGRRPWFEPPPAAGAGPVAIIGAGIAGATVAEALARRGHVCDVYDPQGGPGGASANAQAALHVRPAAGGDARTRFNLAALAYTQRWLADFDPTRHLWTDCGLLQLACDAKDAARQKRCIETLDLPATMVESVDARTAADLAGMALAPAVRGGLYYPHAGWVRPDALCRRLLAHSGATLHRVAVDALTGRGDRWRLLCGDGRVAEYAHVVLACAHHAERLCPDLPPLAAVRGQISTFAPDDTLAGPACVVCGRGTVMPRLGDGLHVGASFVRDADDARPRAAEDMANLDRLAGLAPRLAGRLGPPVAARAAFRCSGHDRLPYVGPVPDADAWRRDYAALALDARRVLHSPGVHRSGLWASVAHGANGLVGAPLAAEMLASRMLDEPMPRSAAEVDALHPGRRLIRELIRGR